MGLFSYLFGSTGATKSNDQIRSMPPLSQFRPIPDLMKGLTPEQQKDYLIVPPENKERALVEAAMLVGQLHDLVDRMSWSIPRFGISEYYRTTYVKSRFGAESKYAKGVDRDELEVMYSLKDLIKKRLDLILEKYVIVEAELPSRYVCCGNCEYKIPWFNAVQCPRCHRKQYNVYMDEASRRLKMQRRVFGSNFNW